MIPNIDPKLQAIRAMKVLFHSADYLQKQAASLRVKAQELEREACNLFEAMGPHMDILDEKGAAQP